ncbi:MAG: hypothetical protein KatS3mg056_0469 [Chloroflexus sp.]|nr:MAG: hypothetical protein KatS3mg056_0469 [Chloroflexus sp.]
MTTTAIFALTRNGVELATRLAATLPATIWLPERFAALAPGGRCYTNLSAAVQTAWQQSQAIMC